MSTWRMAGLNYVNYSTIAAKVLRQSLIPKVREEAAKRNDSTIKLFFWAKGDMLPLGQKPGSKAPT